MSVSYYTFSSQPYLTLHEGNLPLREEGWRSNYRHDELKNVYTIKDKEYEVSRIDLTDVGKGGVAWRVTLLVLLTIVTVGAAWFFKAFRNLLDEAWTRQEIVRHATFIDPAALKTDYSPSSEKLKEKEIESLKAKMIDSIDSILDEREAKESRTEPVLFEQKNSPAATGLYSPELLEAFNAGDKQRFKTLLNDENIDINAPDGRAHDPIVFQLLEKSFLHPLIFLLLRHPRFDPHVTNSEGQTPLEFLSHVRSKYGSERFDTFGPLYKALFKRMDLKKPLSNGLLTSEFLLNMEQTQGGDREMCLKWFIKSSHSEVDAHTLAHLASGHSFDLLRLALQKCKNPNPQTEEDENPLELFLQNTTLLNTSLIYRIHDTLLLFKEKHANFYSRNKENRTPFITFVNTIQTTPYLKQSESNLIACFLSVLPEAYQNGYLLNYSGDARVSIQRAIRQSFSTRTVKVSTDANSAQLMLAQMGMQAY